MISTRDILLTKPIADAVKQLNPKISFKGMKAQPGEQGFPLPRLVENSALGTDNIPPIKVTPIVFSGKTYYSITDGRHRAAIALANGLETIPAIIGGKRRVKKTRRNKRFKK